MIINSKNKYTLESQAGFSLLELIVAISIMIVIAIIGARFVVNAFKDTTYEQEQATATSVARKALDTMSVEIRGANSSAKGDYLLNLIGKEQLIFFSDVDKDDVVEKVNYYADGTDIKRVVYAPDSNNNYTVPEGTTTIALYLNNNEEDIFKFYSGNSTSTETTLINKVRMIQIVLKINVTPWRAPGDYYIVSNIKLRNATN